MRLQTKSDVPYDGQFYLYTSLISYVLIRSEEEELARGADVQISFLLPDGREWTSVVCVCLLMGDAANLAPFHQFKAGQDVQYLKAQVERVFGFDFSKMVCVRTQYEMEIGRIIIWPREGGRGGSAPRGDGNQIDTVIPYLSRSQSLFLEGRLMPDPLTLNDLGLDTMPIPVQIEVRMSQS